MDCNKTSCQRTSVKPLQVEPELALPLLFLFLETPRATELPDGSR